MLVVFVSDDEVIITTPQREEETLRDYFGSGGRNLDDYDRSERLDLSITSRPRLDT